MRWYVMHEGTTAGPVEGEEVFKLGQQGQLFPSMHVRDENGVWMPILQSPFASVVASPARVAKSEPRAVSPARIAIGVVVGVVVCLVLLVGLAAIGGRSSSPSTPAVAATTPEAPAPAPAPPTPLERMAKAATLREAVGITRPLMADVRGEDISQGAALLAVWWARRPALWSELTAMPDSKRAEIMKDPDAYRGQRICMTGTVSQIFRDKSSSTSAPVYMGVLYHNGGFARFIAVQSTQGVVENTPARFCGIAIGLQSYDNVNKGTTHAIQAVGLFDIQRTVARAYRSTTSGDPPCAAYPAVLTCTFMRRALEWLGGSVLVYALVAACSGAPGATRQSTAGAGEASDPGVVADGGEKAAAASGGTASAVAGLGGMLDPVPPAMAAGGSGGNPAAPAPVVTYTKRAVSCSAKIKVSTTEFPAATLDIEPPSVTTAINVLHTLPYAAADGGWLQGSPGALLQPDGSQVAVICPAATDTVTFYIPG